MNQPKIIRRLLIALELYAAAGDVKATRDEYLEKITQARGIIQNEVNPVLLQLLTACEVAVRDLEHLDGGTESDAYDLCYEAVIKARGIDDKAGWLDLTKLIRGNYKESPQ